MHVLIWWHFYKLMTFWKLHGKCRHSLLVSSTSVNMLPHSPMTASLLLPAFTMFRLCQEHWFMVLLGSLPVLFGQSLASSSKRMSRSTLMERAWILKMCVRPSRSGSPNSTFLSSRPGLMRAGSSVSGRFVAMSTCYKDNAITRLKHQCRGPLTPLTFAVTASYSYNWLTDKSRSNNKLENYFLSVPHRFPEFG
jgi:hypothetical protein